MREQLRSLSNLCRTQIDQYLGVQFVAGKINERFIPFPLRPTRFVGFFEPLVLDRLLVDGQQLSALMMDYGVGVSHEALRVSKVDHDNSRRDRLDADAESERPQSAQN